MRNLLYIIALVILLFSCKKEKSTLRQVRFTGSVLDATNGVGISNVIVKMYWSNLVSSLETPIDSTSTDSQGNYVFEQTIEISKFDEHSLETFAVVPSAYISTLDLEHTTVGVSTLGIQSDKLQMIPLFLYPKAQLRIKLNRTMTDTFAQFQVFYNYGGRNYWAALTNGSISGTQTYDVFTAGHIQTRVFWKKIFNSGSSTQADSIICLPTAANEIIMNY